MKEGNTSNRYLAYTSIILTLVLLFSASIFSGLISTTNGLNFGVESIEKLIEDSDTVFQSAAAQNGGEDQFSATGEPDQDQPPPDCEETTAGCPGPNDEVEGIIPLPTGKSEDVESSEAAPSESPTATDVVPLTPGPPIPPGGTVLPYTCSTTAYDKPTCNCVGINDCNELRKSGECKTGTEPTGSGEIGRCPWKGK